MKQKISLAMIVLLTCVAMLCGGISAAAEPLGPVIAVQPQSVSVNYPAGAEFTVVPDDPSDVASYQWYFVDSVGHEFELDGSSASTATLVCPTIDRYYDGQCFFCVLTDADGNTTVSDPAYITVPNHTEHIKLLYIGNYAIGRGETLNLSETELGTGTIAYAADGKSITLSDVTLDNANMVLDHTISNALGITLDDYQTDIDRMDVVLVGENTITNRFYQDSTNGSGITFDLWFTGTPLSGDLPEVHICGDGSLTLWGGSTELRTNGDLYLEAPITFLANGDYFCDAVNGDTVVVAENVPLRFDVNGTLIYAKWDIEIQSGASIQAKTSAPHVMNDYTYKNAFLCTNDITVSNATVTVEMTADPDRFIPYELGIAGLTGMNCRGAVKIDKSTVSITMTAGHDEQPYFYGGDGIICEDMSLKDSSLTIHIDADDIYGAYGVSATQITIEGSTLDCFVHASERVFGVAASGDLTVTDSTLTLSCASADDEAYGMMYKTLHLDLNEAEQKVDTEVNKGFAMGGNIGNGKEVLSFDEEYTPSASTFGEHTAFVTPADATFNHASMKKSSPGSYIYLETPYSAADKSHALTHAIIECDLPKPEPEPEPEPEPTPAPTPEPSPNTGDTPVPYLPMLLAVGAVCLLAVSARRKSAAQ